MFSLKTTRGLLRMSLRRLQLIFFHFYAAYGKGDFEPVCVFYTTIIPFVASVISVRLKRHGKFVLSATIQRQLSQRSFVRWIGICFSCLITLLLSRLLPSKSLYSSDVNGPRDQWNCVGLHSHYKLLYILFWKCLQTAVS